MKVLVIGGGGREHAICATVKKSPLVKEVFCAPGNAGMKDIVNLVNIKDTQIEELRDFAVENKIDLTIVGPETSLSMGIVDLFQEAGLKIFGPRKNAARIESSKEFAKDLMKKYDIPTAKYQTFDKYDEAIEYVKENGTPIVVKFDGLAFGKGVVICEDLPHAEQTLREMLDEKVFGDGKVVIEEFLTGPEFSFMCLVNKDVVIPLDIAQDHKRALDGDKGLNTGGMGAYSGVPFISKEDIDYSLEHIIKKTCDALIKEDSAFTGVLYGGLMRTPNGVKVIEFNARFGDPETEVVLPRIESDLVQVLLNLLDGKASELVFKDQVSLGVVLASKGYPQAYQKGFEIKGLDKVETPVFHMGTKFEDGKYLTNGGRVLFVLGLGKTFKEASVNVYKEIAKIECENLYNRSDIGYQVINFEEGK